MPKSLPQSLPRYLTPFILLFTLFTFAYSIATLVYVRELHNAPPHTPCSKVTPGLREYLRIGGWIVVVGMVVLGIYVLDVCLPYIPRWIQMVRDGQHYRAMATLLSIGLALPFPFAAPILSIQYTNTLRHATTDTTHVAQCLTLAPYRRETMEAMAWLNIVAMGWYVGLFVMAAWTMRI